MLATEYNIEQLKDNEYRVYCKRRYPGYCGVTNADRAIELRNFRIGSETNTRLDELCGYNQVENLSRR
jgi:hypothetical protein